ncbi:MAG: YegP family protein [Asticcacaulis sp.]|nr:YegP family protein [Asticcacaulis sp.]
MAHTFEIRKNKAGEFVAYFLYNSETIFWTEGYSSKASAKNAIDSIRKNGPAAEIEDTTLTADIKKAALSRGPLFFIYLKRDHPI